MENIEEIIKAFAPGLVYSGTIQFVGEPARYHAIWYMLGQKVYAKVKFGFGEKVVIVCEKNVVMFPEKVYRVLDEVLVEEDAKEYFFEEGGE